MLTLNGRDLDGYVTTMKGAESFTMAEGLPAYRNGAIAKLWEMF